MSFIERLSNLLKDHGLTRKEFLSEMKFGKNQITYWEKNKTLPNPSTLEAIALYFNVPVELLTGEIDYETSTSLAMGKMMEWLEDNDYYIEEDENNVYTIGKDGAFCYIPHGDLETESLAITEIAKEGFELAMIDWLQKRLGTDTSLSEQEKTLIDLFRGTTEEGRLKMIASFMEIKNDVEKREIRAKIRSLSVKSGQRIIPYELVILYRRLKELE